MKNSKLQRNAELLRFFQGKKRVLTPVSVHFTHLQVCNLQLQTAVGVRSVYLVHGGENCHP